MKEKAVFEHLNAFQISGDLKSISPLKRGHLNETFIGCWQQDSGERRYIHQRVNTSIFKDPAGLMNNIDVVTKHIHRKIAEAGRTAVETTLSIIPTKDGSLWYLHGKEAWRSYEYIEDTVTHEVCSDPRIAFQAAQALGRFQWYLSDLDLNSTIETIPHFSDIPRRFLALEEAISIDAVGRVAAATEQINFARRNKHLAEELSSALVSGAVKRRVTPHDLKINNVLFDERTGEPRAIVDLDTCMPGNVIFDFGDLVRSAGVPAREDEQDFSKVFIDPVFFEALADGYVSAMGSALTQREVELLPTAPGLLGLTLGVRFLTDYLNGDKYFRVERPEHNLERACTQFRILDSAREQLSELRAIVTRAAGL